MKTKAQLVEEYISFLSGRLVEKHCKDFPTIRFWVSYDHTVIHHLNQFNDLAIHDEFKQNVMAMFGISFSECNKYISSWANKNLHIKPSFIIEAYQSTKEFNYTRKK